MSEEKTDRKPDVVSYESHAVLGDRLADKVAAAHAKFAPIVGEKGRVVPGLGGRPHLYFPETAFRQPQFPTLAYPLDHGRAGEPRFRWEDQGGGVRYGYLTDDAIKDMREW